MSAPHYVYPALSAAFAVLWLLIKRKDQRGILLNTWAILLMLGVARHATILVCWDACASLMALSCALAVPVFFRQASEGDLYWWTPARCRAAGAAAALWAAWLGLGSAGLSPWLVDLIFSVAALLLWLGRSRAEFLLLSAAVLGAVLSRETFGTGARVVLACVWTVLPFAGADPLQARLDRLTPPEVPRAVRFGGALLLGVVIFFYVVGPVFLMTNRESRRVILLKMAPTRPDPAGDSPLAARLRAHVTALAGTIGERDAYNPKDRDRARDYVLAEFKKLGYKPVVRPYPSAGMPGVKDKTSFYNVEAVLAFPPADRGDAWVVGAHYDSAPGTPGADDDASGVAVLLEAARLLRERAPGRQVRFVAFGTEEPPSFGTRNMGSWHYAAGLNDGGVRVHGALVLEMLGFYNPRRGSQLYPPFLHLFYPDHGDFIGAVADVRSRGLLAAFGAAWKRASAFPMTASILPGPFASLALSDQLNFWELGFPALMISDTAFYRNANYHESTDLPATLDYEKMARITEALVAVLEERGG